MTPAAADVDVAAARAKNTAALEAARLNTRNVCALVDDAGVKRVRVMGWFSVWPDSRESAMGHARSLRDIFNMPVWVDRLTEPATLVEDAGGRQMDWKPRQRPVEARKPIEAVILAPKDFGNGPPKFAPDEPYPVIGRGIHVAGERDRAGNQFCTQCGGLMASTALDAQTDVPFTWYPVGSSVQRGNGWQAGMIAGEKPTCARPVKAAARG